MTTCACRQHLITAFSGGIFSLTYFLTNYNFLQLLCQQVAVVAAVHFPPGDDGKPSVFLDNAWKTGYTVHRKGAVRNGQLPLASQ